MSKDILGSLMRVLVTVPEHRLRSVKDFANKLAGSDGEYWERQGKLFLQKKPFWPSEPSMPSKPTKQPARKLLIDIIGTCKVAATTEKFIARDRFVLDTSEDAVVKISDIGDNFKTWFLSGDGKIEAPIVEQILRYGKLRKAAHDVPLEEGEQAIIPELGGEDGVVITLTELHFQMKKQGKGQRGILLTNGYVNIFYIRDKNGVLRAVRVNWSVGGWYVHANEIARPDGWGAGRQVFSRNSVLKPSEPVPAAS